MSFCVFYITMLHSNEEKQRIFDEIIALPTEEDSVSYDGMIFVKKLECANIMVRSQVLSWLYFVRTDQ